MTFLQAGQDVRIGGRQSNAQYQYTIQSENLQDLVKWGPIVLAEMRKLRGFTDVNSDQLNAGLQASLSLRSSNGRALRDFSATYRRHALRRVRAATGLNHIHFAESIPRSDGS